MAKRYLFQILMIGFCWFLCLGTIYAANIPVDPINYLRLLEYIEKEDLSDPLMVFGGIEENFDRQLNMENINYINANNDLLKQIQSRLKGEEFKWRLETSFKQLWVVPENRNEYAQLFERYCREAVAYLLTRIKKPSPYIAISTLKGPLPEFQHQQQDNGGITAYLVHNIADVYVEEYLFFDEENDGEQVKIKLSNREFSGKIGSYTSKLKIGRNNQFEFIRERFTLWQNSARNPYNVLIVPVEETLHIILRSATEKAMHEALTRQNPKKLNEVNAVINYWMAIEESVVGGIVCQIMPELLNHVTIQIQDLSLARTMEERNKHDQYRFLRQGIDLVHRLGIEETLDLYQNSAMQFRLKLLGASTMIESAKIIPAPLLHVN